MSRPVVQAAEEAAALRAVLATASDGKEPDARAGFRYGCLTGPNGSL
jgi:hypothetical protein